MTKATGTETVSTTLLQVVREPDHVSLALALAGDAATRLATARGTRIVLEAGGVRREAFFHGPMRVWGHYRTFFGAEALAELARDPGVEAFVEDARIPAARKVPGQDEWLRVRASLPDASLDEALFLLPEGAEVVLHFTPRGAIPRKKAARVADGELRVQVLASHPQAMVLDLDAIDLKKLGAQPDDWHELVLDGITRRILARRGIPFDREEAVWSRPEALLFDYVAHWDNERRTVMLLRPMQWNWKGHFPEWAQALVPVVPVGTPVAIRLPGD